MIYTDSSILLAELLDDAEAAPAWLWNEPRMASRLLQYEVWNRLHAYGVADAAGDDARLLLGSTWLLELVPDVLARALEPFPTPVRTLDALHLATAEFVRHGRGPIRLATLDRRMAVAARAIGLDVLDLGA